MNNYKIIFIDIDGTLRNDYKEITSKTKEIITKLSDKGIISVICSGRPRDFAINISKECNAGRYVISSNGAEIYDYYEDKVIFCNKMDSKICEELYYLSKSKNARFIMCALGKRVVSYQKYYDGSEILLTLPIKEFLRDNDVSQCVITSSNVEVIKSIKNYVLEHKEIAVKNQAKHLIDSNIPLTGSAYIDVSNIDTSKGLAIQKLLEYLNIDKSLSIGVGDDYNDLSMFESVGYKIAMGNAFDDIKKKADLVTNTNNENGLANALIEIFNIEE